ncbi:hypothetical protein ACFQ2B_33595 [Streptomyces stramineus]
MYALQRPFIRRSARLALSVGAALALVTGLSAQAQAANGTLSYKGTSGVVHEKVNPTDGVCYSFDEPAVSVDNFTDTDGKLFTDGLCGEASFFLNIQKGSSLVFGGTKPKSARLGG